MSSAETSAEEASDAANTIYESARRFVEVLRQCAPSEALSNPLAPLVDAAERTAAAKAVTAARRQVVDCCVTMEWDVPDPADIDDAWLAAAAALLRTNTQFYRDRLGP